jgi:hypothetical protein
VVPAGIGFALAGTAWCTQIGVRTPYWALLAADGSGTSPDRCRPGWTCYFFPFFLLFLLFLAIRLTPLPDSVGQQNVDQASTYH